MNWKKKEKENNLENIDIIFNNNLNNNDGADAEKFCDEGVQTSLVNLNDQGEEINNKKEEPLSTIIFTDKSALINQEITFLSIQCSLKNNGDIKASRTVWHEAHARGHMGRSEWGKALIRIWPG